MSVHLPFVAHVAAASAERPTTQSCNPATGEPLPDRYALSAWPELAQAVEAAQAAAPALQAAAPETIAQFLTAYAAHIEANGAAICRMAALETALPYEPRLHTVELARTTDQLRQAAAAVRERAWTMATIDSANNIRSMYRPLNGPVLIFGPNNFPLAFNAVAGGDFAAAIAAGNPVIAKAHPAHLSTSRLLAEAARAALAECGLPPATVQMFYHCAPDDGLRLVAHPGVKAVAFTGSRRAGLALKAAADEAGTPIYLEMSSVNPVFMLPGALAERGEALVAEFAGSCLLATGQFCTNPGLVVLPAGPAADRFMAAATDLFAGSPQGTLLSGQGADQIAAGLITLQGAGAELLTGGTGAGFHFANTLLRVPARAFLADPAALQTEAFGPVSLLVVAADLAEMVAVAAALEGNLTGCIYSDTAGSDDDAYDELAPVLRAKVGRLLNDKMPTGVAVSPAMVHGGPYPATGHPGFTSVGLPASIHRFAALHGYDNVRAHRLPPALRDKNPTGRMWRFIDGQWSQGDVNPD